MPAEIFTIIQITYTVALPLFFAWVGKKVSYHTQSSNNGRKADMLLLRKTLIDIHDEAMANGYITRYSFQAFEDVWSLYHNGYKGNTLTDQFREEIKALPIR